MKINQVAVQMYTLRDYCKTPGEIAASLKKVREIGYQAVQASGFGPIAEDELVRLLNGEGLTLCATHENPNQILNDPTSVVEKLKKLGCKYTAYPYPAEIKLENLTDVKAFAARLDAAGKILHEAGQVLTYHNHQSEFRRIKNKTILAWIFKYTNPRHLAGELDTHWVQQGGCDSVAWCRKLKGRLPLLHIKDFAINEAGQIVFSEIGNGNLDWKKIIAAAEKSGCEWFIVEQDDCPGDPFDSLRQSFDYIKDKLCSN